MPTITSSEYSTSLVGITHEISCYGLYDGWSVSRPTGGYPGSQGYSFIWRNNNNEIKSLQDSASNLPALYSYTVTVTDMNNCSQSAFTSIFDQPVPFVADVTTTNYAGATHAPFAVNFIDNTISADPFDFNWTWEDDFEFFPIGTISMDHDFIRNNIGLNQVYVVLTNTTTGCTDTVFFDIDVQGIPDINNVFTPNSDGINDEYSFGEYAMAEVVVNIYNRWGQLVYIWEGMDKAWRGVDTNGENVPEGVYFYVFQSDGEDGYYYEEKGTITLLR
jgi:gliding motility-associated-like protein